MKQTRRAGSRSAAARGARAVESRRAAMECCDLGRASLLGGELSEALWYLRQAVENDSECSVAWQLLGRCFEEMGEAVRARRCYALAFRLFLKTASSHEENPEQLPLVWPPREPRDS